MQEPRTPDARRCEDCIGTGPPRAKTKVIRGEYTHQCSESALIIQSLHTKVLNMVWPSFRVTSELLGSREVERTTGEPIAAYRGTSLLRKCPPLAPYRRPVIRILRGSLGGGRFLTGEVPL